MNETTRTRTTNSITNGDGVCRVTRRYISTTDEYSVQKCGTILPDLIDPYLNWDGVESMADGTLKDNMLEITVNIVTADGLMCRGLNIFKEVVHD